MTDKIVQFTDGESNNIFPVAGAMKSGSVTTSTINDNAVTKAKINLSTLDGNYSTAEFDTGYTWIDGKTIYKKTVNTGQLPNATSKSVNHDIANFYRLVKLDGWAYSSSYGFSQTLPLVTTDPDYLLDIQVSPTTIKLSCTHDRSAFGESYVTLYYTKSA